MPDSIVCTCPTKSGSFSRGHGPIRFLEVPDKKKPASSRQIDHSTFAALAENGYTINLHYQ